MLDCNFSLFETMLVFKDRIFLLQSHLNRIYQSAIQLGFDCKNIEALILYCNSNASSDELGARVQNLISLEVDSDTSHNNLHICDGFARIIKNFLSAKVENKYICNYKSKYNFRLKNKFQLRLDSLYKFKSLWSDVAIIKNHEVMTKYTQEQTANSKKNKIYKNQSYIMRITLKHNGILFYEILPLSQITNYNVFISKNTLDSKFILHRHKSTNREHFIDATQAIAKNLCFDYIYTNEFNEITEGSRSNIIMQHGKKYYTPHSSSQLLCGTLRSLLLNNNLCQEKILYKKDIHNADSIFCINSVRGIVRARLMDFN